MAEQRKRKEEAVDRGMPKNVEAEQALLCSVLIDNFAADEYIPKLNADDFYLTQHQAVVKAMRQLLQDNRPVDLVSVADKLTIMNKLDEAGSMSYLASLTAIVPSSANAENYYKIIKRDSLLRKIVNAGVEISKKGYGSKEGEEALEFAEKLIYDISQNMSPSALTHVAEASADALNEIQSAQKGEVGKNYTYTGFPTLDRMTRGLKPGDLVLIAARPSEGKTAFALNIAANVAINERKTVALFSLEMPTVQLVKRIFSYVANVSATKTNAPRGLSTPEFTKIYEAYSQLVESKLFVDDYSMNTPSDILAKSRRLKNERGLDIVIIDYLQLMEPGERLENRQQEVSQMSRRLKVYAKDLGVPFIVLSQMSRGVENRPDHLPKLADLRESGAIEQDADIVMFLHNPSKYQAGLPENRRQLIIEKHRNGEKGTIDLEWTGETNTFKECVSDSNAEKAENKNMAVSFEASSGDNVFKVRSSKKESLKNIAADFDRGNEDFEGGNSSGDLEY